MHQKWDQSRVIDRLRARYGGGQPLYVWKEDYGLYAAACRQFGSWRAALDAAGLPLPTKWTRERVLAIISHRHQQQMPLTAAWRDDPRLYQAAIVHFGSWTDALKAADLPRERRWTPDEVIAALKSRYIRGQSMKNVRDHDRSLYSQARRVFGSWRNAIHAAGLPLAESRGGAGSRPSRQKRAMKPARRNGHQPRVWSPEKVIEEFRRWHRAGVTHLRSVDQGLSKAAKRYFGSLDIALEAAGLAVPNCGRTKGRVLASA
jgi:hypothetical protein